MWFDGVQAASRRDRDEWVAAIHAATARPSAAFWPHTIGGSGPSIGPRGFRRTGPASAAASSSHDLLLSSMPEPDYASDPYYDALQLRGDSPSLTACAGAAAPFADDIARYCSVQQAILSLPGDTLVAQVRT